MENVPDWAERRCSCGAYLDETDVTYQHGDEEYCEACSDAIASVN